MAETTAAQYVIVCGFWQKYHTEFLEKDLNDAIEALNGLGIKVIFVLDNPQTESGQPYRAEALSARWDFLKSILVPSGLVSQELHATQNEWMKSFVTNGEHSFIDLGPVIYGWQALAVDNNGLYVDKDHLSDYGVLLLRETFVPIFEEMTESSE